ncbi:MAG: phosphodiester glycosidase family protein [Actinomycetota bacterium]|nr:phosphodiester glycosidase family protein [Actinomycetota bacterium]
MWRRRVAVVLLVALAPVSWSYYRALSYPGSAGWEMRTVEWLRSHGAGGTVDSIEVWYYTRHHPPTSGVPKGPLPRTLTFTQARLVAVERTHGRLPRLTPAIRPSLRGEAVWHPGRRGPRGRPAIYTTWFRPDPAHPTLVAGELWIDPSQARLHLVAGTKDPGGGPWPGMAEIEPGQRSTTLAAFNSGFLMAGAHGGFYENGRTYKRLRRGKASVVISPNGRATVAQWGRDIGSTRGVAAVRQNLALIVDHGHPVRGLTRNTHFEWGSRQSQLEYVWRSGLGVDAQGHLIYIAGNKFTLTTLAAALVQAHAVRAMELDIHNDMVSANLFSPQPGHVGGVRAWKLLPQMPRPATRYLQPDQRDFFTVSLR